uniref:F-box associated domain-containing protein n=1 Tax=Solanum lycopersicum TaxID=4081 RepID=A0A3Q7HA53_SOLLC
MSILLVVDPWITRLLDFIKGDALTDMIEIMSSCGGLILCCCHKQRIREYYVCNPSTNQFSIVPSSGGARHFMNGLHTDDGWIPHVSVFELGNEYLWILKYRNDPL